MQLFNLIIIKSSVHTGTRVTRLVSFKTNRRRHARSHCRRITWRDVMRATPWTLADRVHTRCKPIKSQLCVCVRGVGIASPTHTKVWWWLTISSSRYTPKLYSIFFWITKVVLLTYLCEHWKRNQEKRNRGVQFLRLFAASKAFGVLSLLKPNWNNHSWFIPPKKEEETERKEKKNLMRATSLPPQRLEPFATVRGLRSGHLRPNRSLPVLDLS